MCGRDRLSEPLALGVGKIRRDVGEVDLVLRLRIASLPEQLHRRIDKRQPVIDNLVATIYSVLGMDWPYISKASLWNEMVGTRVA